MASHIERRKFLAMLGGAAAAWPLAARAQQAVMPVIGFLRSTSLADVTHLVTAFRHGLRETGYVEGQNVAIEYRSAEDHLDRLPALVADLIRRPVAVIVGNHNAALAAKAATTTVPIVFVTGSDPIRDGLVASLSRPGGNVTGVSFLAGILGTKRLELLRQLVPAATTIAVLVNPDAPDTEAERREVQGRGANDRAATHHRRRAQRCRYRDRVRNVRRRPGWRAARRHRSVHALPSGTGRRVGGATWDSRDA
jgi:ABC-type uncharacterized transport system substrate-binding protein